MSTSPTLEVTVSDADDDPLDVTFYGREAGALAEDFTIVVLPDTQFYSESYPAIFNAQTQWIVDNKDALNIVYVVHEGDVVNVATTTSQWVNADAAMDILDAGNVPYGIALGNHDEGANYNTYFGVSRFAGKSFFGGEYPSNDMQNNYMLFSAGGMDFIVINLDYYLARRRFTGLGRWPARHLQRAPRHRRQPQPDRCGRQLRLVGHAGLQCPEGAPQPVPDDERAHQRGSAPHGPV